MLNKTYYIETYGCQMNVRDSETVSGILENLGFSPADNAENAEIIVFNTCCVREHAEKRLMGNIGALKPLKEEHPELRIVVMGCMMQQKKVSDRFYKRFPFVDLIMGTNSLDQFEDKIKVVLNGNRVNTVAETDSSIIEGLPRTIGSSFSSFVNIMYGCNNYCTYCIVPYVRGPERSRKSELILKEISDLASRGITEITLLGQNVNSYGSGNNDLRFHELLEESTKIKGIHRVRFMTSHPKDLSDELINAMARNDAICPHVHLPLQSGSDRILKKMNRKYDMNQYRSIVSSLRAKVKDVEITTDLIVGFPGETDSDFEETLNAVNQIGFANAFTFKYSKREGTIAAKMEDQIPEEIKKERLARLNSAQNLKTEENNKNYIGYTGEVLIGGIDSKSNLLYGKYPNFKMVYFEDNSSMIGQYRKITVDDICKNSLRGHISK